MTSSWTRCLAVQVTTLLLRKEGAEMKVGLLLQKLTNGLGFDGIAWPQGSPDLLSKGMV